MNESQHEAFLRKGSALVSALRDEMTERFGETIRTKSPGRPTLLVAANGATISITDEYLATIANQPAELDWGAQARYILDQNADHLETGEKLDLSA